MAIPPDPDRSDISVFLGKRDPAKKVDFMLLLRGDYIELWVDAWKLATLTKAEWTHALAHPKKGDTRPENRLSSQAIEDLGDSA
jgi:hypothetical protein